MHREYHKWFSNYLQKDMELLVFGKSGKAVLFFPTRMARFFDYEDWRVIEPLRHKIANGDLQIFCVDSNDKESFYNQKIVPAERINRHLDYEGYILHEVMPFIESRNGGSYFEVAGCSMGAYHAMNLALKYPQRFQKVVAMSGRYDLTHQLKDFADLFDGYHDETVYYNMPLQFVANLRDHELLKTIGRIEIIVAIGETDPFLESNKTLSRLFNAKGVPHQLYIWDNDAHRPRYWRQMVQLYL